MSQLTNLVVNQTANNIMAQFGEIEKARSGVYADTAENRKLQRVGQHYGSKKQEEPSQGKPKGSAEEPKGGKNASKDDRFSEDGIIGQDGGFNKHGKTYKRWAALREKVESGKATPEEKKEFAHLHNQYMNEKDRHAYEQSKKTDPKAKEPKYKTVDERREEYKAKQGKSKEQKENEEKKISPAVKKLLKDDDHKMAIYISNFRTNSVLSYSKKLSDLQADGMSYDSPAFKRAAVKEIVDGLSHSDKLRIAEAADKYGPDVVKEAMVSEKGNSVNDVKDTGMTDLIAEGIILASVQYRDSIRKTRLEQGARSFARNYVNSLNHSDESDAFNDDYLKLRQQGFTDAEIRPEVERLVAQDLSDYISPNEVKPFVDEIWDNLDMQAINYELNKKK